MAEPWFIQSADGTVSGPFHERQISADLIAGKIPVERRVRQGETGPWCDASRAREIFQQLAERGWYIQSAQDTFGPFTADRLLELHRLGELADDANVRQGSKTPWKPAVDVLSLWQSQPNSLNQAPPDRQSKWSTEPIRHYMLPLELAFQPVFAKCKSSERLRLIQADSNDRLAVVRSNDQTVGYFNHSNSQQLLANCERGITHVVLFPMTSASLPEIAVVLCPPGTQSEECRSYINNNFSRTMSTNG